MGSSQTKLTSVWPSTISPFSVGGFHKLARRTQVTGFASYGVCIGAPFGSGNCPDDQKLPSYNHLWYVVDSNNALNQLTGRYPDYKAQLRLGASKTFVVVTDDEATTPPNNSAAAFTASVALLDPDGHFLALYEQRGLDARAVAVFV